MDSEPILKIKVERIIALKRFEQPPPGYFHLLPDRIMARIEDGEGQASFWERWWPEFAIRPSMAYALGLSVCGALTFGLFHSPTRENTAVIEPSNGERWAIITPVDANANSPAHGLRMVSGLGSTYPVPAPQSSGVHFGNADGSVMTVSLFLNN